MHLLDFLGDYTLKLLFSWELKIFQSFFRGGSLCFDPDLFVENRFFCGDYVHDKLIY